MQKSKIVPSILNANFIDLRSELLKCKDAGIEWLHYDVMDFDFVPNLTFGSKILKDIVKEFSFKIDIHFMINVKTLMFRDFFKDFIDCKPKMMTMHLESLKEDKKILEFIDLCKEYNIVPSLAVSPETDVKMLTKYLKTIGNVLVMSVKPGFGGQKFISSSLDKINFLQDFRLKNNCDYTIEVDGGINKYNYKIVKELGADLIVVGSYLFEDDNLKEKVEKLNYE